jgi:hypothetical protein
LQLRSPSHIFYWFKVQKGRMSSLPSLEEIPLDDRLLALFTCVAQQAGQQAAPMELEGGQQAGLQVDPDEENMELDESSDILYFRDVNGDTTSVLINGNGSSRRRGS